MIFVMPILYFYVFLKLSYMMTLMILKSRYLILVLPDVIVCLGLGVVNYMKNLLKTLCEVNEKKIMNLLVLTKTNRKYTIL